MLEVGSPKSEVRRRELDDGNIVYFCDRKKSEDRRQKTEDRRQKSEDRSQKSEVRI